MTKSKTKHPFKPFSFTTSTTPLPPVKDHVIECLKHLQSDIPSSSVPFADTTIPAIIISALISVNAWPCEDHSSSSSSSDPHFVITRDRILQIGSMHWTPWSTSTHSPTRRSPQDCWTRDAQKRVRTLRRDVWQHRWKSTMQPVHLIPLGDLKLTLPRNGPSEVWSPESVQALSGRRIILSYVHDKNATFEWAGDRRPVKLTRHESVEISRPQFLGCRQCSGLDNLWHDGMKYPTPDGQRNGYAGVIPYMLPGSAVWHSVPRLRNGYGYPSLDRDVLDSILVCFAELRCGKRSLSGIDNVEIEFADDEPYRDLSGVRRLWLMAEATCGMLRDDLIISAQDLAGVALTLMHYDNLVSELGDVANNHRESSTITRKRQIPCICPARASLSWEELCKVGEGARVILRHALAGAGLDETYASEFREVYGAFNMKVRLLKFWYALMLAKGPITNLRYLRFEVLEDIAVAPAWEPEDRAMVYFMVEAAIINRLERQIPYEESIRRFMRARNGGALLLDSVNMRSSRIVMEMTRVQLEKLVIYNLVAAWRQPGWSPISNALRAMWLMGDHHAPSYLGRFTTSTAKQLYIQAARSWAGHSDEMIIRTATEGKARMVVLLNHKHRLNRYIDVDTKTEIIVCSIFYMDEEEYNLALSNFGNAHFHAEDRMFRGKSTLSDAGGHSVAWDKTLTNLCAVTRKGSYFSMRQPQQVYQIVVVSKIGAADARLAAIRTACNTTDREPVAVSPAHIMSHIMSEGGNKLFEMRPDQLSPDGKSVVDYAFEYEMFWADSNGRTRSTMTGADSETMDKVVDSMIASLRAKHWK
eukprot:TRINITY_DN41036_c0_g1_i1.p1 TRINITY_DN41036_c0_g1~~TRINITY_DN41036_c0_g1_i1.p1  ORF type:complete len:839 (+),score=79.28 TRINITY_DN41036_c0_g1_i1:78-2519(+)